MKWTSEDMTDLFEMWCSGFSTREMVREMDGDCSEVEVRMKLRALRPSPGDAEEARVLIKRSGRAS